LQPPDWLSLADAPVSDLALVCVTFTHVSIHPADGSDDIVVDVSHGEDSPACDGGEEMPRRSQDLKSLSEGNSVLLLGNQPLPQGDYSWIRLDINSDNTFAVVDEGGEQLLLDCSSCDESHLKLNRSFIRGYQVPVASSRPSMVLASRIVPSRTWPRAVASGSQWTSMSSWACGRDGTRDSCRARNR
jgi:hypothetical protein